MDIHELRNTVDSFGKAMKIIEEKSNSDADLEEPARAEIAFLGLYLIFDDGSFDEEELKAVEEASGFKINREHWNEIMELGRVNSEENYLSQPPNTFMVMVDIDNTLYEAGEEMTAYVAAYEVYKLFGEFFVNIKGLNFRGSFSSSYYHFVINKDYFFKRLFLHLSITLYAKVFKKSIVFLTFF